MKKSQNNLFYTFCLSLKAFSSLKGLSLLLIFASISYAQNHLSFQGSIELESESSFSRMKMSLDPSFNPIFKETKKGFELRINAATLMDLGVPFGSEELFNQYLSKLKDNRIVALKVQEDAKGVTILGQYQFPTGASALAAPAMEHFDFRKDETGKYCIDFWYKKGLTEIEAKQKQRLSEVKKIQQQKEELIKRELERKKAREARILESKNALLFCEQSFDRSQTVFLKYHADHPSLNFSSYFPEHVPDHRFEYHEPKGNSEENQMIRLAVKLSRENNHALTLKTIDFLEKEYPGSKSREEMQFLKANSYYRLGLEEKGRDLIQKLAKTAKKSEVGVQSQAFLAVQAFKNKEWLLALDGFNSLKRESPNHSLYWLFRYGIAECLYEIRQAEQSKAEYEWVAAHAPKEQVRAEASFKVGDVYFVRGQYALAMQAYLLAISKNEKSLSDSPQVLLNLAETYFQLEEYKKSEETFKRYLEYGKNRPHAWRASLRIAEIQSLNQKHSKETEKAFTETINRYPMTLGATIARLRLLPCGSHGGFDGASSKRFFSSTEIKELNDDGVVHISVLRELVGLTEVRTLLAFNLDAEAIEKGMVHLRNNPTVDVRRLIEVAMIGGIKRLLEKQLSENNGLAAIATYEKYGDYLPMPSNDPLSDDLRIALAKYASDKKLTNVALKLIEPYRKLDEQLSDAKQKELLASIEKTLSLESVSEQDARNFIEIKTKWNGDDVDFKDESDSNSFLNSLNLISDSSRYSFERDLIKALFFQQKNNFKEALDVAKKLTPRFNLLGSMQKAQIWALVGDIAEKAQDYSTSADAYHQARILLIKNAARATKQKQASDEFSFRHLNATPTLTYLYTNEGEMLDRQEKWKESVALYAEALENKIGGNHILYAHARALLKMGGRDSKQVASRSLEKIKQSQEDDVWKSLALKTLDEIAKEGKVDEKRKQ